MLVEGVVAAIKRHWPTAPAWLVSWSAGILVIFLAAAGIFVLAEGTVQMVAQGPALVTRLNGLLQAAGRALHLTVPLNLSALVGEVKVGQVASFVLSGVQGVGGTTILVIIYFGFTLAGRQRISKKFDVIAASSGPSSPNRLVERAAAGVRTYMWVQTVTGVMITLAVTVAMVVVGLHNVLFWTVVFFLLTYIPNIGVTVGSIAPALFALLQFPTARQAIVIFAASQFAAFVVGNVIYPKMQAETQNIDPLVTILSLSFWTILWGISGAFLAVPLTLMTMIVFAQFGSTRWITAALSNDGKPDFGKREKKM